jgi:2-polyprenyl-3-methyl-5-hydroxy-6-metoxy-1,4-benzoquinol methylase
MSEIPLPFTAVSEMEVSADYTVRDQERMEHARRYFAWQSAMAEKHLGPRVLEIGCGLGNFTQHLTDRELVLGIDVEPRCIEAHRKRFSGRQNISSICMDVQSPDFPGLRRYQPVSIACLNVLEHVRDDATALAHMNAVLPSGGTAVLIVPACGALYGPIDKLLGHYRRYSKAMLAEAARRAGFRFRVLRHINSIGFFGWWFNARILKRTEQSAAQIEAFDRIVPVLSRVESWMEPPIGQSIFAVMVKP